MNRGGGGRRRIHGRGLSSWPTTASHTPAQIAESALPKHLVHLAHLATEKGEENKDRKDEWRKREIRSKKPGGSIS